MATNDWSAVRRYYEDTWFDYHWGWITRRAAGMHCGYVEPGQRGHANSLLAMNAAVADEVGVGPDDRVLDAGCGVGGSSVWLAAERRAQVVGVNIVPSQIAFAVKRARRYGVSDRTEFVEADLTDSGLTAGSFDVAWLQESSCHIPDKEGMLREMHRVLRPGGRVVVADFFASPDALARDDFRTWVASWEMSLATEDEWRAALESAGFGEVRLRDVTEPVSISTARLRKRAKLLQPPVRLLEKIGARNATQIRNTQGGHAMWSALQAGAFRYGILTATRR